MNKGDWHIYLGAIPYSEKGNFWVSFESDPHLEKTKANIYGKCLPCWKITAVLKDLDACLLLLSEFERRFQGGHVYGKFGSGRPNSETRVVVFHTEEESERDKIKDTLLECIGDADINGEIQISRACAVLYEDILGDWRHWQPTTPIENPEKVADLLERIRNTLFWSVM
jgi:hypothetical protein